MNWYVVQCTPQNERKAVAEIRRAGFRAYLPLRAIYRRKRGEELPIKRYPALVGYIFVRFPVQPDWFRLHLCQGVRGVLCFDGHPYAISHTEVAAVMRSQREMRFDAANARAVRRAWINGEKNARRALAADRFRIGSRVYDAASMVVARVLEVTKKGTIRAIIETKERVTPVEFHDTERLQLLDA